MNRVCEFAATGRVLFAERRPVEYEQPERWGYSASVVLLRYEVDEEVGQRIDRGLVPQPYLLVLRLAADSDSDFGPVVDEVMLLNQWHDDGAAIRFAISRFDEMRKTAKYTIADWRVENCFDAAFDAAT